jgi:hypothetical protein
MKLTDSATMEYIRFSLSIYNVFYLFSMLFLHWNASEDL